MPELPRGRSGKLLRSRFAAQLRTLLPPLALGELRVYALETLASQPMLLEEYAAASAAPTAGSSTTPASGQPAAASLVGPDAILARVLAITGEYARGLELRAETELDEAGVNSLAGLEICAKLGDELGLSLPTSVVSDYPTPGALANHLASLVAAPSTSHPTIVDAKQPAAPLEVTGDKPSVLRVLMLHGEGADAHLMQLSLRATGWCDAGALPMEFECIDAPHLCAPKPQFHAGAVAAGVYTKRQYRSWGVTDQATFDASITAVLDALQAAAEPCHGVGGICDGGLVAAVVASRRPELQLYLNIASSPLDRLPAALRAAPPLRLGCASIHLISPADEMLSMAELLQLPSLCERATVLQHDRGHAVPPLRPPLRGHLLTSLAPVSHATPDVGDEQRDPAEAEPPSMDSVAAMKAMFAGGGMTQQVTHDAKAGYLMFLICFSVMAYHYSDWLQPVQSFTYWDAPPAHHWGTWFRWPDTAAPHTAVQLGMAYWPLIKVMYGVAMPLAFGLAGRVDGATSAAAGFMRRTALTWGVMTLVYVVVVHLNHHVYFPLGRDTRYIMATQMEAHLLSPWLQLRNMLARTYSFAWFFAMLAAFRTMKLFSLSLGFSNAAFAWLGVAYFVMPRHRLTSPLFGLVTSWHVNHLKVPKGGGGPEFPNAWFRLSEFKNADTYFAGYAVGPFVLSGASLLPVWCSARRRTRWQQVGRILVGVWVLLCWSTVLMPSRDSNGQLVLPIGTDTPSLKFALKDDVGRHSCVPRITAWRAMQDVSSTKAAVPPAGRRLRRHFPPPATVNASAATVNASATTVNASTAKQAAPKAALTAPAMTEAAKAKAAAEAAAKVQQAAETAAAKAHTSAVHLCCQTFRQDFEPEAISPYSALHFAKYQPASLHTAVVLSIGAGLVVASFAADLRRRRLAAVAPTAAGVAQASWRAGWTIFGGSAGAETEARGLLLSASAAEEDDLVWDTSAGSTGPPGGARRSLWTAMRELWPWCATHLSVYLTSMASSLWLLVALLCATSHLFIDVKAPMEQATLLEVAAAEAAKLPLLSALPGASEADATALGAAVAQGRAWVWTYVGARSVVAPALLSPVDREIIFWRAVSLTIDLSRAACWAALMPQQTSCISLAGSRSLLPYLLQATLQVTPVARYVQPVLLWAAQAWPLVLPTLVFVAFVVAAIFTYTHLLPLLLWAPFGALHALVSLVQLIVRCAMGRRGSGDGPLAAGAVAMAKRAVCCASASRPVVLGCAVTALMLCVISPAALRASAGASERQMVSALVRSEVLPLHPQHSEAARAVAHACHFNLHIGGAPHDQHAGGSSPHHVNHTNNASHHNPHHAVAEDASHHNLHHADQANASHAHKKRK